MSSFLNRVPDEASVLLFCVPHAGGGASVFRSWAADLGLHIGLVPIQLPGRENRFREPAFNDLTALVPALADEIITKTDRPFAFYGHSLGGLIAYETVRWIHTETGRLPEHLFIGACRAPHLKPVEPPFRHLPSAEFLVELQKRYGGIPKPILDDPDFLEAILPMIRADVTAFETYDPQMRAPLACAITVFGGVQDSAIPAFQLPDWQMHTVKPIEVILINSGHFFLQSDRATVTSRISMTLRRTP